MTISPYGLLRRLLFVVLVVFTLGIGVTLSAVVVSRTDWFHDWLRKYLVSETNRLINGQLMVRRLEGSFLREVGFGDVSILSDDHTLVSVSRVTVKYNIWAVIRAGHAIREIRIEHPVVRLRRTASGWVGRDLFKPSEKQDGGTTFEVTRIVIEDGEVHIDDATPPEGVNIPKRVERVNGEFSVKSDGERYDVSVARASFRASEPALALHTLSGRFAGTAEDIGIEGLILETDESRLTADASVNGLAGTPTVDIKARSERVSLPEIGRIVPAISTVKLTPSLSVDARGPLSQLTISAATESTAGRARIDGVADLMSTPQSINGTVDVEHLNLAPLLNDARQTSDLTGRIGLDLRSSAWPDLRAVSGTVAAEVRGAAAGYQADAVSLTARLDSGRADIAARFAAYRASGDARGTVTLPEGSRPIAFDLRGHVKRLNLDALPRTIGAPAVATDVSAAFHAKGTQPLPVATAKGRRIDADFRFEHSRVPGLELLSGSRARVSVRSRALAYSADATVRHLNVEQLGRSFSIPALADNRYKSDVSGHIVADGRGTSLPAIDATIAASLDEAALFGGRAQAVQIDATVKQDRADVRVNGTFADLDAATLTGRPEPTGTLGGHLSVAATIDGLSRGVTADNVTASGQIALDAVKLDGYAIDRASLDADYAGRMATVRALEVAGRDLNATASGTLALGYEGDSDLKVTGNTQRLAEVGRSFDLPIEGSMRVDATVSGNASELIAKGTLNLDQFAYEDTGALSSTSTFEARLPHLDQSRIHVDATTRALFVTAAGQQFNQVDATLGYEQNRITFDGSARQPQRTLDAAGILSIRPEYQEARLDRLVLQTGNQMWSVPDGVTPTVKYGGDRIEVRDLTLASGPQQLTAEGVLGQPGEAIHVTATGVELASVDALLLRPPQFTGVLDATADVRGTTARPDISATFEVRSGAFRQFKYERLSGVLGYNENGIDIDARLQQDAAQWITAKGHVPKDAFAAEPVDAGGDLHQSAASPAERFDLAVDSSALGLGLIQGFTTEVTNVAGSLEAHLRITGSARDPHPEGRIAFHDGAVTLPSTGVSYKSIGGTLEFQPDRLHIAQITVLDNHDSSLSITGDVAMHAGDIGDVQIWVNAGDFKVIDNKIGNVRLQSDLEIGGELKALVVRGDVAVSTGRIDLDEIIAITDSSPYATRQTEFETAIEIADARAAAPSLFQSLRASLRLSAPDDFVVRARNLRSPGAAIGFGALNVTLGGDLTATKEPHGPIRIAGAVNTVRGTYDFQGRRFDILRDGEVRFDGVNLTNPTLDIRTRREIQSVEANVTIRGTLAEPEIQLSSSPPLEEADILSLIVFNQPVNQLGEGDQISLAARAQSLAIGAAAGQLAQSLGNALNLDTFEIAAADDNSASATVTVGQQVSRDLYVKLEQGVGESTTTNVVVEYALTKWLRLQSNVTEGDATRRALFRRQRGSGADLIFLFAK